MAYGTIVADTLTASTGQTFSPASGSATMKNRIINGAMMIDQRNAGASFTPTDQTYSLDRWKCRVSQASKYTVQQNAGSVTPPVGFSYYLGVTSTSSYTVGASERFVIHQRIESNNVGDLAWGTANAKTVTLSFNYPEDENRDVDMRTFLELLWYGRRREYGLTKITQK